MKFPAHHKKIMQLEKLAEELHQEQFIPASYMINLRKGVKTALYKAITGEHSARSQTRIGRSTYGNKK